ncbi:HAD hydrolase [Schizopora paradoxa]|uniref:HAD hydrolase n=1 Tax=Schizopora paradoxa TaxID=27342 RepID=A0A0H2RJ85_9AGAM|nr:HAD hydrolase [Schizopora paradoxa]
MNALLKHSLAISRTQSRSSLQNIRLSPFSRISTRSLQTSSAKRPPLAFAFDIDGVLIRGEQVIPQAKRALEILEGDNELGMKIPFVLITNGGGTSETIRCQRLSKKLGMEISVSQFMQSHTVLKSIVHKYAEKPVLVLGGRPGAVPRVAAEYGFRNVSTTLDILRWNPSVWPFHDLDETEKAFLESRPTFDPSTRFSAIIVFHDPRNWALDVQITCDILRSDGYVLPSSKPRKTGDDDVKLIFCNPDLLWGSDYPTSRIGQGGFRAAFQGVYKALTGSEYPYVQYGKPTKATYRFAEKLLRDRLQELHPLDVDDGHLPNVYMIGDNPESDIAGANAAGWHSVLVETGVYDRSQGSPAHRPTHLVKDVEKAVRWAVHREISRLL